jgi:hypothetical protein
MDLAEVKRCYDELIEDHGITRWTDKRICKALAHELCKEPPDADVIDKYRGMLPPRRAPGPKALTVQFVKPVDDKHLYARIDALTAELNALASRAVSQQPVEVTPYAADDLLTTNKSTKAEPSPSNVIKPAQYWSP